LVTPNASAIADWLPYRFNNFWMSMDGTIAV